MFSISWNLTKASKLIAQKHPAIEKPVRMARKRKHTRPSAKGITIDNVHVELNSQPKDSKKPMIFDLPLEIVLEILERSVVNSTKFDPIDLDAAFLHKGPKSSRRRVSHTQRLLQPPVTETCRFLRTEGLKIFYSRNVFLPPTIYSRMTHYRAGYKAQSYHRGLLSRFTVAC